MTTPPVLSPSNVSASHPERAFEQALRGLRRGMRVSGSGGIVSGTIAGLGQDIVSALDSNRQAAGFDPQLDRTYSKQWFSLLTLALPNTRLRGEMAGSLGAITDRLSTMDVKDGPTLEDGLVFENHKRLTEVAKLIGPPGLAKHMPVAKLMTARDNIAWYADFAPDTWGGVATSFERAMQATPTWKAAAARTAPTDSEQGLIRHAKPAVPTLAAATAPAKPAAARPVRTATAAEIEARLGNCLARPAARLLEAVQVVAQAAADPVQRAGLDKHNGALARMLVQAARRDPDGGSLLGRYVDADGGRLLASAGLPPRKLKAVLTAMPGTESVRMARRIPVEHRSSLVKRTVAQAGGRDAAEILKSILHASDPSKGYRKVIAHVGGIADKQVRRAALEPVLPELVQAIFSQADRKPVVLRHLDRLIPLAGSKLMGQAGLTGKQVSRYADHARATGKEKALDTLLRGITPPPLVPPAFAAALRHVAMPVATARVRQQAAGPLR